MRFESTIFCALVLGCQAKDADDTPDTGPDWWETDTDTDTDTDTTAGDGKTYDTGKNPGTTDSKSDSGGLDGWFAEADPDAGTGTLSISEDGCEVTFSIDDFSPLDDCERCTFAHSFVLSSPTVVEEGTSGCDAVVAHEGEIWQYGQGAEVTVEFSGVAYYELFAADGGDWTILDGGYSTEADGAWAFGKK